MTFLGNTQLSCSFFSQIYFKHKILPHLKPFFNFYLICECFAYTSVHRVPAEHTEARRARQRPLKQELQTTVSYQAGAGNQTRGLCKSLQESSC